MTQTNLYHPAEGTRMSTAVIAKPESRAVAADPRVGKYLTFLLGREEFAIRVFKVREIMGLQPQIAADAHGEGWR